MNTPLRSRHWNRTGRPAENRRSLLLEEVS